MLHSILKAIYWLALVFFAYGAVAAPITFLEHRRTGARTMAAEAMIAWCVSAIALGLLWYAYDYFI